MEQTIGNVTVTAEIHDTDLNQVSTLSDVTTKYDHLTTEPKEHLYALFLNGANETLAEKLITIGGAADVRVDLTDIARTAILTNARAVILVHNHPSGDPTPSTTDIETTKEIRDALALFDIDLLDHVIISRNEYHSMRGTNDLAFTT